MDKICILSDFDGTITEKDGLYGFFVKYANENWHEVEQLWVENKISSKECLLREFECVDNLSEDLIKEYMKTVKIDKDFKEFYDFINKNGIDFYVVSDGADYFINNTLKNIGIDGIKVISNHFEISGSDYNLTFPNDYSYCKNNAGTCKCKVADEMKKKYDKVIYIGDGISDFCVCNKADILFAKKKLINYCRENNIEFTQFETFKDVTKNLISLI